jgi:lipopolysaccharide biosynthesis protein
LALPPILFDEKWYLDTYPWIYDDPRSPLQFHLDEGVNRQYHPHSEFYKIFKPVIKLDSTQETHGISDGITAKPELSIAVVMHAHRVYEVQYMFANYLRHFSGVGTIFITSSCEVVLAMARRLAKEYKLVIGESLRISNIGRDIPSKYLLFNDKISSYDICFFTHGKFSDRQWLAEANTILSGSASRINQICSLFKSNPSLGVVYPDYPISVMPYIGWGSMRSTIDNLLSGFGCDTKPIHVLEFPAGGFFWARPQALIIIYSLGLSVADLPREPLPKDNTILHALERLPCISCEMMGMEWEKIR